MMMMMMIFSLVLLLYAPLSSTQHPPQSVPYLESSKNIGEVLTNLNYIIMSEKRDIIKSTAMESWLKKYNLYDRFTPQHVALATGRPLMRMPIEQWNDLNSAVQKRIKRWTIYPAIHMSVVCIVICCSFNPTIAQQLLADGYISTAIVTVGCCAILGRIIAVMTPPVQLIAYLENNMALVRLNGLIPFRVQAIKNGQTDGFIWVKATSPNGEKASTAP